MTTLTGLTEEIFETLLNNPTDSMEWDFITEKDMNNIEALGFWIDEFGLDADFIEEDNQTQLVLSAPGYDFKAVIDSYGLGDFFTHGVSCVRVED